MVRPAVTAAVGRGRTTARNCLGVATSGAGGVGTPVHGVGVVEGAKGQTGAVQGAPGGDMAITPAVLSLSVLVRRVGTFNRA